MLKLSLPARLVPPLAAVKLVLGIAAFFAAYSLGAGKNPAFVYAFYLVCMLAFGITGALLVLGGRRDRRALALGCFFLAAATAWANQPLRLLAESDRGLGFLALVRAVELHAFLPYFLWVFVREFPVPLPTRDGRRVIQAAVRLSALAGLLLFALCLAWFVVKPFPPLARWLETFTPIRSKGLFYQVVMALLGLGFLVLPWKAHQAQGEDRRRARVFLQILTVTFMPMVLFLLVYVFWTPFQRAIDVRPKALLACVTAVLLPAIFLPVSVPYAVLVHRVLDVRLIARRAVQHALARSMALVLVAVPAAALVVYIWAHRQEEVGEVFSGPRVPLLISVLLIGAAALRYRRTLLDAIDRRFFREQYDARQILSLLVERIRSIHDTQTLADLVTREIELALHLEKTALLTVDARTGVITDPKGRLRKLDASSTLALTASNASAPLDVELEETGSPFRRLPDKERQWLEETGFRLLVPILARDGSLLGLLGLGEKRSGLPFLREDRQLLHAIAANAAWVLELEQDRSMPTSTRDSWSDRILEPDDPTPREVPSLPPTEPAKECPKCGALHPSYTVLCGTCSRRLETSAVPYVLPGKFRFDRRIGVGGMGVVYSGTDLALARRVALKTLRHVSPEDATRLRREARTAAAVSHPHLAPIYGLETWKGTPLLVLELLEGGTLAQRIFRAPLAPRETVNLGMAMAGALGQLHKADILHRDIKPSNIGYTRDGVPKLMDFGIARFLFEPAPEEDLEDLEDFAPEEDEDGSSGLPPALSPWDGGGELIPAHHRFAGTLSYLSPEALRGARADETFDLWSLALVLFECLLGKKIFTGPPQQVMARIKSVGVPDFSQVCPEHDGPLGDFFREALHRSLAHRPATAEEMRERLEEVREEI